jgi:hypothetical protein
MKIKELKTQTLYKLTNKKTRATELAVFMHIGETGWPIFHPEGEPSFQDWFGLKKPNDYIFELP